MTKAARLGILNLLDNHCNRCEYRYSRDLVYCWESCEIGKEINDLGIYLGGQRGERPKSPRTKEEWNKIYRETMIHLEQGNTYGELAERFGMNQEYFRKKINKIKKEMDFRNEK